MKIAINTQYRENYGAHDWDGEGECPQYWKCKGGSTYVLQGLSQAQAQDILENKMAEINALISYSSDYSEEYVISCDIFTDEEKVCDDWESPVEIYQENGAWTARCVTKNDEYGYMNRKIVEKQESYSMGVGGVRENHKVFYLLITGELVPSQEVMAKLEA